MKGAGFFVGGLLLETVGFRGALWLMAGLLAAVLLGIAMSLPRTLGKAKASKSFRELFAKTRSINLMAAARIFLFGSRDVWFVVGLPVFLYSQGWRYMEVAGFIASWTIGYGLVQAIAPSVIRRSPDGLSREVPEARLWGAVLTAIPLVLALVVGSAHVARLDLAVTIGLGVFGFAVISSLYSYLILAYAGSEKAAEDVGFYYAANAGGRLIGILLSLGAQIAPPTRSVPTFAQVEIAGASSRLEAPDRMSMELVGSTAPASLPRLDGLIEIVLSDGVTLRVDAQVDGRALRRVLGALAGR